MIAPIKITSRAVEEIINILKTKGIPQEYLLRVSIKGGHGCSGVNFTLGFDKKKELTPSHWFLASKYSFKNQK